MVEKRIILLFINSVIEDPQEINQSIHHLREFQLEQTKTPKQGSPQLGKPR